MHAASAALTVIALLAATPPAARADAVSDQIAQALDAYGRNDIATTLASLNSAAGLLRQQRGESWHALLPAPPPGWTEDDEETGAAGVSAFGVGSGVLRKYTRDDAAVEISIMAESPLVQTMAEVLRQPTVAEAAGRFVEIGGRRFIFLTSQNAFFTMVADRALVRVQGGPGMTEAALRPFVAAVDFPAIERAAH